ncbi:MAG: hypothetical protein ACRCXC_09190 [Legionella sp.]
MNAKVAEYYPKGETLSIANALIKTKEKPVVIESVKLHKYPYHSLEATIVNGPETNATNVGEKIGLGLAAALNAIVRGQTVINMTAHSRGAVESWLITHELNSVKELISSCVNVDQLLKLLTEQQTARQKGKPLNNTPDIIAALKSQLPKTSDSKEQWFNALKANIGEVSVNLFAIDPVHGDCWPITWVDERFTLPPIVKNA